MTEYLVAAAAVAALAVYLTGRRAMYRLFGRLLQRELIMVLEFAMALLALTVFTAASPPTLGLHNLYYLLLALFLVTTSILVLGVRHVLEEFLTGIFALRAFNLHVGDYIEVEQVRGYITQVEDAYIVVRDTRKELVHIPYTYLVHRPFKKIRAEEGHEVRVPLFLPYGHDLKRVRDAILSVAAEYGIENLRVDVDSVEPQGAVLVVRGIMRDPRREDEARYAILDKMYAEVGPTRPAP